MSSVPEIVTLGIARKLSKDYADKQIQLWLTCGSTNKGAWNAATNTPTIIQGTGTGGWYYVVQVAGTWDGIEFKVGDMILFDITKNKWVQIPTSPEHSTASADTVKFTRNIETNFPIGNYNGSTTTAATIPVNGKSLQEAWDMIFTKDAVPTITQPSVEGNITSATDLEVGSKTTPTFAFNLNPGSYQYGPATGVTVNEWLVSDGTNNSTSPTGSFPEITITDGISYQIGAVANHSAGAIPKTSRGNDYPAGQIHTGTKSKYATTVTGFRKIFWGYSNASIITSDVIRGLAKSKKNAALNKEFLAEDKTKKNIIIAAPAGTRVKKLIQMPSSAYADVTSEFHQVASVMVEGANRYTSKSYDVWLYQPASMAGTYEITFD